MKLLKNHWFFNVFLMSLRESLDHNTFILWGILMVIMLTKYWFFNAFQITPTGQLMMCGVPTS